MEKSKTRINREQSFHFQAHVTQVFWQGIESLENANSIARTVIEFVAQLKTGLDHGQRQLQNFQECWCKECTTKNSINADDDDNENEDDTIENHTEQPEIGKRRPLDKQSQSSEANELVPSSFSFRPVANKDNNAEKEVRICQTTNDKHILDMSEKNTLMESSENLDPLIDKLRTELENDSRILNDSLVLSEILTTTKIVSSDEEVEPISREENAAQQALLHSNWDSDSVQSILENEVVLEESCSENLQTGKTSPEVDSNEESSSSEQETNKVTNHKKVLEKENVSDDESKEKALETENGSNRLDVEKTLKKSRQRVRVKGLESLIDLKELEKINKSTNVQTKDKSK